MMHRIAKHKIVNFDISDEDKIICLYRYISWFLTSAVYLVGKPNTIIYLKLGVIISLFISSKLITKLYIRLKENKPLIKTLVLIETVGITLLLIPTGGIFSPFIWYALNPTLVAATYLPLLFCWLNLLFYLYAGYMISLLFNSDYINIILFLFENYNLILVFILITLAVQLLSDLTKKLSVQKKELQLSNSQKEESIEHIMSLYKIIEALNSTSTKEKLFEVFAKYTEVLTKSRMSFFWLPSSKGQGTIIKTSKMIDDLFQETLLLELERLDLCRMKSSDLQVIKIQGYDYLVKPIITQAKYIGLIAIQKKDLIDHEKEQTIKLLEFMAGLSAVTLERFNLEETEHKIIVMGEQNRIASEIHDNVSQRLFSVSYAIRGILGRIEHMAKGELIDYLEDILESSNLAREELRNSIYKLSSRKKGDKTLYIVLKEFIDNIGKLNQTKINFVIKGNEGLLTSNQKQMLNRIIREACSNSIRHGESNKINIELVIYKEHLSLCIEDNGKGFEFNYESIRVNSGIGISNMYTLIDILCGTIDVHSEKGKGTEINIIIPLKHNIHKLNGEDFKHEITTG